MFVYVRWQTNISDVLVLLAFWKGFIIVYLVSLNKLDEVLFASEVQEIQIHMSISSSWRCLSTYLNERFGIRISSFGSKRCFLPTLLHLWTVFKRKSVTKVLHKGWCKGLYPFSNPPPGHRPIFCMH